MRGRGPYYGCPAFNISQIVYHTTTATCDIHVDLPHRRSLVMVMMIFVFFLTGGGSNEGKKRAHPTFALHMIPCLSLCPYVASGHGLSVCLMSFSP